MIFFPFALGASNAKDKLRAEGAVLAHVVFQQEP